MLSMRSQIKNDYILHDAIYKCLENEKSRDRRRNSGCQGQGKGGMTGCSVARGNGWVMRVLHLDGGVGYTALYLPHLPNFTLKSGIFYYL